MNTCKTDTRIKQN